MPHKIDGTPGQACKKNSNVKKKNVKRIKFGTSV